MKKLIVLFAVLVLGCESNSPRNNQEENYGLKIITVYDCEYLYRYDGGHMGYVLTHKGNCKYCIKRNKGE